jgi:spore coat protein U-like protein
MVMSGAAFAGTTAAQNMGVTSNVTNTCAITTSPTMSFSTYDPSITNKTANLDATTSIGLTCTSGAVASIGFSDGINGITDTTRAMNSGANLLSYQLYTDSGRGTVWTSTPMAQAAAPSTAEVIYTVYGRVPGAQNAVQGDYSDTVAITVNF